MALVQIPAPEVSGMTLLSTTACSGTSTIISGISGSYNDLIIIGRDLVGSSGGLIRFQVNGSGDNDHVATLLEGVPQASTVTTNASRTNWVDLGVYGNGTSSVNYGFTMRIFDYAATNVSRHSLFTAYSQNTFPRDLIRTGGWSYTGNSAITSITVTHGSGSGGGTILIYGVR